MKTHARVVVIGGGIVGCSVLYHLTRMGWSDVLLLERDELTAGSTWHAAGNCPNFSTSFNIMKLQAYSNRLYRRLPEEVDSAIGHRACGSIRLAHTDDRMAEFRHVAEMAAAQGLAFEILAPSEMRARHPFLETHDVLGGLWDPDDGDIDPSQVTQALAKGARTAGAAIYRHTPVRAIERTAGGEWRIATADGTITCEIVVNAAGYRAREIGRMVGLDLPVVSLQHQYLVTEAIPEIEAHGRLLPLVRDPDVSWYLRQERAGLLLGPYEWDCRLAWDGQEPPAEFGMELFEDDLDRLERYIEDAMARVPVFASAGVTRVINGPIPYTPDGNPLIGPAYGLDNFFLVLRLQLRHRAGRRRRQGDGRMDHRRRAGVGSVGARSAPLHGLRQPGLRARQGQGALSARVRDRLPGRGAGGGAAGQDHAPLRDAARQGGDVRRARRLGAGDLVRPRRRARRSSA